MGSNPTGPTKIEEVTELVDVIGVKADRLWVQVPPFSPKLEKSDGIGRRGWPKSRLSLFDVVVRLNPFSPN